MKSTFRFVFNVRKKENQGKIEKPIYLEIYFADQTRAYITTKIKIEERFWDSKRGEISRKHQLAFEYNEYLNDLRKLYEAKELDCIKKGIQFNRTYLNQYKKNKKKLNEDDFIEFCHEQNKSEYKRQIISFETWKKYNTVINSIQKNIMKSKTRFCDLENSDFLEKVETFTYSHHKGSGCQKFINMVKRFTDIALKKEMICKNPFENYKKRKVRTKERPNLTEQEVKELENIDRTLLSENENIVLDRFLFSCYTGIRIGDSQKLKKTHIIFSENGHFLDMVTAKMQGARIILPLDTLFGGKPAQIITKYLAENSNSAFVFPQISDQKTNKHLKRLATLANIDKTLTFHVSRHTCASLLAEKTGNPFVIMQILGHSDIKTSMIYIHNSQKAVLDSLKGTKW